MNNQRSELSPRNKYYIPKFRYLELKNFCMQYKDWKLALLEIVEFKARDRSITQTSNGKPTEAIAMKKLQYESNIKLIEDCAIWSDPVLYKWIIIGVTENYSYDYLHLRLNLPAGRDMYYDIYRRFFWILDQKRK